MNLSKKLRKYDLVQRTVSEEGWTFYRSKDLSLIFRLPTI